MADTSIYNNLRPVQIDSPIDSYAKVAQLQQAQNQNRLADMTFAQHQRTLQSDNALASLLGGGKSGADVVSELGKQGFGSAALDYQKKYQEGKKSEADVLKTGAETQKAQLANVTAINGMMGSAAAAILKNPTYENAMAVHQQLRSMMPPEIAAKMDGSQIPRDPVELQKWANNHYLQSIETEKQMADATSRRNNDQNNQTSRANNAATVGASRYATDKADARARDQISAGKVPAGYRMTADGKGMEAIPGGPADIKANQEAGKRTSEAKDVLMLLDEVGGLLPKATGGYLGTGGDIVAAGMGWSTEGAKATAQLKALQGALVSKMPKMSGPQSDKDVQLYREMAGQVGDSTVPVDQRQAASVMIRKLNEKYAGMPEGSSKPAAKKDIHAQADAILKRK